MANKYNIEVAAIDFDGTIFEYAWPNIGPLIPEAKEAINKFYDNGGIVIIWTCREGQNLEKARQALLDNGVKFHEINNNCQLRITQYGNDCRKVGADIYIDDRDVMSTLNGHKVDWKAVNDILNGGGGK